MMSGFSILQALTVNPIEEARKELQANLQIMKNRLETLEKSLNQLLELEHNYHLQFEKNEVLEQKTKGLTMFGSPSESLLPDLDLRGKIKARSADVQQFHQAFLAAVLPVGKLSRNPLFINMQARYAALVQHLPFDPDDKVVHAAKPG